MSKKFDDGQLEFENFYLPFGGKLRSDNRWVILAKQVPWQKIEARYGENFSDSNLGCPPKPARMALGALIIKERLGTSDEETVEQIMENPYLQFFLGYKEYTDERPFDSSTMVYFRKRFTVEMLTEINEAIVAKATGMDEKDEDKSDDEDISSGDEITSNDGDSGNDSPPANSGKLLIDATCTPADITYPTDLKLLNDAREKTEEIIDAMHRPMVGKHKKPRTYRQKARKQYLAVAKQKKPGRKKIRKAIGQQLRHIRRNLKSIDHMINQGLIWLLGKRLYRLLLVISEVYRQQLLMYENSTHKLSGRIVSLSQPHVRPIVRGKAKSPTEFGAKISVSLVNGFSYVERINWEAYNESGDLKMHAKNYRRRFGFYPASIHADKIYRTRENRKFCKERGIRLSGQPLGRPPKITAENAKELKAIKRRLLQDEIDRIPIEGKFGQGKRRFTLERIMAKLAGTAETVIMVSFITMNLEKILAGLLSFLLNILLSLLRLAARRPTSRQPHTAAA
jgi:hypothetical protein